MRGFHLFHTALGGSDKDEIRSKPVWTLAAWEFLTTSQRGGASLPMFVVTLSIVT
ncbi:hypothetical protein [Neisseria sicca]|uniref:hypothetical protein n=1 Tax=Neisseria sicca TaxID=490 RepID=UPI000AE778BE|nr:hypothetical protein [Neisseria sicca]